VSVRVAIADDQWLVRDGFRVTARIPAASAT